MRQIETQKRNERNIKGQREREIKEEKENPPASARVETAKRIKMTMRQIETQKRSERNIKGQRERERNRERNERRKREREPTCIGKGIDSKENKDDHEIDRDIERE